MKTPRLKKVQTTHLGDLKLTEDRGGRNESHEAQLLSTGRVLAGSRDGDGKFGSGSRRVSNGHGHGDGDGCCRGGEGEDESEDEVLLSMAAWQHKQRRRKEHKRDERLSIDRVSSCVSHKYHLCTERISVAGGDNPSYMCW